MSLPLGLGFVFSGFEETGFFEFSEHEMRACLCFMDPDENGTFRLENRYVHDTRRELAVAAITRRGENPHQLDSRTQYGTASQNIPQSRLGLNFEDEIPISWEVCNTPQQKSRPDFFIYYIRVFLRVYTRTYSSTDDTTF